jgi:hypothetical protein
VATEVALRNHFLGRLHLRIGGSILDVPSLPSRLLQFREDLILRRVDRLNVKIPIGGLCRLLQSRHDSLTDSRFICQAETLLACVPNCSAARLQVVSQEAGFQTLVDGQPVDQTNDVRTGFSLPNRTAVHTKWRSNSCPPSLLT